MLRSHGALEEHNQLQTRLTATRDLLQEVERALARLESREEGESQLKIDMEQHLRKFRHDHTDRREAWEPAVELFAAFTDQLYPEPGKLKIDVEDKGLAFDVEIGRAGSHGVSNMKILCYDLVLAALWAARSPSPGFLVHDSMVFDGVDERQRAKGLELAAAEARERGYQSILTLNSDEIPENDFSDDFKLNAFVCHELSDANPDESLMGMTFEK